MNIIYKWGFYIDNKLVLVDAQLNTDETYYKQLKQALKLEKLKDHLLERVGGTNYTDGHYLMAKNFKKNQIAYSFGINNDVSWDSAMVDKGYQVFMYDHTICNLPYEKEGFNYFKQGIAGTPSADGMLNTLENFIKTNGHSGKTGMILKMDVEGAEWDFLDTVQVKTLRQFDQIILELHNLVRACGQDDIIKRLNALNKLNKTHQIVHLHANNTGYILQMNGHTIPDVLEVTYVNRERYNTFEPKELVLPIPEDIPCDKNREDINLSTWNVPFDEDPFMFNI